MLYQRTCNVYVYCLFTACNRTYYGEIGRTYELEVRRPREDRLPFLCHLNFTAAGGIFGDLIQVGICVLNWRARYAPDQSSVQKH